MQIFGFVHTAAEYSCQFCTLFTELGLTTEFSSVGMRCVNRTIHRQPITSYTVQSRLSCACWGGVLTHRDKNTSNSVSSQSFSSFGSFSLSSCFNQFSVWAATHTYSKKKCNSKLLLKKELAQWLNLQLCIHMAIDGFKATT